METASRRAERSPRTTAVTHSLGSPLQRGLRIDQYERAQTGVWYYQVDIEVYHETRESVGMIQDELEPWMENDVQYYSVRRRYSEFLQLYENMKQELLMMGSGEELPAFPQKEYISPKMFGLLWRMSSSMQVLEERRERFETFVRWIEDHPILRFSCAYIEFLGTPPQSSEGYVSLKEYSSQHWLSSLEQLTKEKEKRRRRSSSDASICSVYPSRKRASKKRARVASVETVTTQLKRPRQVEQAKLLQPADRNLRKKRSRSTEEETVVVEALALTSQEMVENSSALVPITTDDDTVAQVESSILTKKRRC